MYWYRLQTERDYKKIPALRKVLIVLQRSDGGCKRLAIEWADYSIEQRTSKGNRQSLCTPQIQHDVIWHRTWVAAVRSQQLNPSCGKALI
jgi:hypothetical protein